jgi:electron transfer flavoprotein alpha subunit
VRVAALVKQIPEFEHMTLGPDGRLDRTGVPLEMSAYDRRAVAKGVELARAAADQCTVITLGPESAVDVLREALAFGADDAVHICDPAFAGSDTLATARALAAALRLVGPFDLVLVGRNSVDADTGQVGPELAELLDLPFATGVKQLDVRDGAASVRLELDDERVDATITLPAVLSTAERLIDPCKIKDPAQWVGVDPTRIRRVTADELGPGPWGQAGSPTSVGETRTELVERAGVRPKGSVAEQVSRTVEFLKDRGAFLAKTNGEPVGVVVDPLLFAMVTGHRKVGVLLEPGRERLARELLGGAARLARLLDGSVVAFESSDRLRGHLSEWGADTVIRIRDAPVEEDVAAAITRWLSESETEVVLTGSTAWGREVASRVAASLGAGLTGDAVGLTVEGGRLVAWKPAFGGTLVAAITSSSRVQLATVRPGVLPLLRPRQPAMNRLHVEQELPTVPRGRVLVHGREREDDIDALANADVVIGVGAGVDPDEYDRLEPLRSLLGAELAATRKVTDKGWMPHARQIGITGHAISPRLYLALGTSGKYNHTIGVRSAGTIIAVNPDPEAPVFGFADVGIVGDWREAVDELERQLRPLVS